MRDRVMPEVNSVGASEPDVVKSASEVKRKVGRPRGEVVGVRAMQRRRQRDGVSVKVGRPRKARIV